MIHDNQCRNAQKLKGVRITRWKNGIWWSYLTWSTVLPRLGQRRWRTVWKPKFLHLDPSLWRSFLWAIASWYLASIWKMDSWSSLMGILNPMAQQTLPLRKTPTDPWNIPKTACFYLFLKEISPSLYFGGSVPNWPTLNLDHFQTWFLSVYSMVRGSWTCCSTVFRSPISSGWASNWRWRNLEEPNPLGMREHIVEPCKDRHAWNGDKLTATFSSLCLSWSSCKFEKFDDTCWDSQHLRSTQCHQQIPLYTSPCWNRGCIPFHPFSNGKIKRRLLHESQSVRINFKKNMTKVVTNQQISVLKLFANLFDHLHLMMCFLHLRNSWSKLERWDRRSRTLCLWLKLPTWIGWRWQVPFGLQNVNGLLFLKRIPQHIITIWIYPPPSSGKKQQDYETFLHSYDRGCRPKRSFNHVYIIGWGGIRSKV